VIEPQLPTMYWRGAATATLEAGRERFGFVSVGSDRMPAAPLPTGDGSRPS
jgi:hypothetical protein